MFSLCPFLPSQIPTMPRSYRERDRERERMRRESETEEEERERVLGEVSDGEESDDTAYDRRHPMLPSDLPWLEFYHQKASLSTSFRFMTAFRGPQWISGWLHCYPQMYFQFTALKTELLDKWSISSIWAWYEYILKMLRWPLKPGLLAFGFLQKSLNGQLFPQLNHVSITVLIS